VYVITPNFVPSNVGHFSISQDVGREDIYGTTRVIPTYFVHVAYGRDSVLFRRRSLRYVMYFRFCG